MTNTEQGGRGDINDEAARWKLLPLSEKHVEKLKSSDITATTAGMRGYKTVYNHEELDTYGFVRDLCRREHVPGLLIPLLDTRGSTWGYQYRADNPRCDIHGKPFKYESQGGARGGCNALDFSPRTAGKIDDPKVEKWITEGALKGDALAQVDLCAISVRGVSGYRGRNAKGGKTMLASWEEVAIENSDFVIAYDSDIASNPMVAAAAVRLDDYLFHRKARTRYLVLPDGPDGKKQGVDDYLKAGHTVEELYRLVQPTLPPLIAPGSPSQPGSPGSSEAPPPPPPYGSIDGAAVLDKVEAWFRRFIRVTFDDDIHLLSLWTAHTHLAGECYTTPRLLLDSLVEGAGKSTVLDHLKRLGHPVQIASLSSSALLPRLLHSGMRTILLDEVHRTLRPENPGVGDLLAIINTGYRAGATRPVNVPASGGGGGWEVEDMPTFPPVAMAGNDPHLENDTRSRTIRVLLMPDLDGSIEDTDWEYLEDEAQALQEEIAQWSASASSTVKGMVVDLPEGCIGRSKEKWRPLKRIAVAAGGRWPKIADRLIQNGLKEEVAVRAAGLRKQPPGMVLLNDLYAVWPKDKDFMPTIELVDLLVRHHPDYWGDNSPYGRPLNVTRLGTLLNQATNTTSVRPDRHGRRGYTLAAIQPAWTRLGIPPENPEHPANPVNPEQDTDTPDPDCSELAECAECSESYETPTTDSADHAVGNGQDPRAEEDRPMADEFDKLRDRLTKAAENTNQEGVTNA